MSTLAVNEGNRQVACPLAALVRLIKEDLAHGDEAAKSAARPYYTAAGEKMLEAKGQMQRGEFTGWIKRNFDCGIRNAQLYMSVARATLDLEKRNGVSHSDDTSFREAIRKHTGNTNFGKPATWRGEIDDKVKQAQEQAKRLRDEELTRQQEREAERKLAIQLIDIGFKALASKFHPDKGGSRDAMSRLNRVRYRLKQHA
jgi:hypothetical protein